jgi:hypothetical protein
MYCSTFVFVVDVVSSFNHKAVKWLMTVAGWNIWYAFEWARLETCRNVECK